MTRATRRTWAKRLGVTVGALLAVIAVWLAAAAVIYSPEYVRRVVVWGESDQGDYLYNFPRRPLAPSPTPFSFRSSPDDARVRAAFASVFGEPDLEELLTRTGTQAFIVIKDDQVRYEHYFNGADRDAMLTSSPSRSRSTPRSSASPLTRVTSEA